MQIVKARGRKYTQSDLICRECGNIFTIMRPCGEMREKFHKKTLYCYICKRETIHIELLDKCDKEKELEFKNNRTKKEEEVYQLIKLRRRK